MNIESRKKPFVLMLIPFLCVIHLWPISFSEGGLKVEAWCVSFGVCFTCRVKLQCSEKNRESILFHQDCFLLLLCLGAQRSH